MLFKRFIAFLIDWLIIVFPIYIYITNKVGLNPRVEDAIPMLIGLLILVILILLRDLAFGNASIGKKIMDLKVVDENNKKPSVLKLIKRNTTLLLVPLELISILMDKDARRMGDQLANTKVISNKGK